jgi:hypothetical protein
MYNLLMYGLICLLVMPKCRNPTLAKCRGETQHLQSWGFGAVATLALGSGSRPRQRGCKVAGQEEGSPGVKRKEAREQRQRHWKGAGQEEARESSHTPGSLRKCKGV